MALGEKLRAAEQLNQANTFFNEYEKHSHEYGSGYTRYTEEVGIPIIGQLPQLTAYPDVLIKAIGTATRLILTVQLRLDPLKTDHLALTIQETHGWDVKTIADAKKPITFAPAERCLVVGFSHPSIGVAGTHRFHFTLGNVANVFGRNIEDDTFVEALEKEAIAKTPAYITEFAMESTRKAARAFQALTSHPLPEDVKLVMHGLSQVKDQAHLQIVRETVLHTAVEESVLAQGAQPVIDELGREGRVVYRKEDSYTPIFIPSKRK